MAINLIRIDDRLIHGQVVEGWLRVIGADKIVIISDELAEKENEKILFSLAVPVGVTVDYLHVQKAVEALKNDDYKNDHVLILVESPREILQLLENGVKLESINVGGLHFAKGKVAINDALYVDQDDCILFEKIADYNVMIESRVLPNDKRLDVVEEIRKIQVVLKEK
ncbi:MAG: PTS sugar transporter subunit IIB [bacterium]